jgi:site-specific DNA-methyltransferase (adenine-specific)
MIIDSLKNLAVPIDSLLGLPNNPRKGDVNAVMASLSRFGQRKPIVVRKTDNTIIAGNHTWQAAKELGWKEIAVVLVEDDDATANAFALADNRTAELGSYDEQALLALIRSVEEVDKELLLDTGWSASDVDELNEKIETTLPKVMPTDEIAKPSDKTISNLGDVWLLGNHRLICGDSSDVGVYEKLLGDDRADCVWTDPPYGVDIQEQDLAQAEVRNRRKDGLGVLNDNLTPDKLEDFLRSALGATWTYSKPGASFYVASPAGDLFYIFATVLKELEVWRHTLIWAKDMFVMGRADYHYQHEPIFYGWKAGAGHNWFGDRKQSTLLNFARPKRIPEHPTMKPIELVTYCLENSAPSKGIVLDPFSGSGTTLMACEYSGRKARAIELDPRYVDVICRRWQQHTGNLPVLESTGITYDFTKADTDAESAKA